MNLLLVTPTSVSAELINTDAYFTDAFEILLNGQLIRSQRENCFSLYGLKPGVSYELCARNDSFCETLRFQTLSRTERVYHSLSDDGSADDTALLQQTVDSLSEDEFLTVRGVCRITSLFLRDGLCLHLPEGSVLLGETDRTAFPVLSARDEANGIVLGIWEGTADDCFASILTGIGVKNVCIYGQGTVDCQAQHSDWWIDHRVKRLARRPKGIFLHTCEHICLEGITVCNTPSWNQHPFYCRDIRYINVSLRNPPDSPTTDGIDPESCDGVLIVGAKISVGDDCIAVKSGKLELARKYQTPSCRITIRNCLMERGHAGVTLGSENSGGIHDVTVTNCLFCGTDRGLRIKSQRGRGSLAVIQDIVFRNIVMEGVLSPFVINAFYKAGNDDIDWRFERTALPVTELTPRFLDFTFEAVVCKNVAYGVGFFLGLPESPLHRVTLRDVSVSFDPDASPGEMAMTAWQERFCRVGFVSENLEELVLERVHFSEEPEQTCILRNVGNVKEIPS